MMLTNHPQRNPLNNTLPDMMCETCESYQRESQIGHHTYLAVYPGLTDGTVLWFCSESCFKMSPVPTLDDGKWPGKPAHV